MPAPMTGGFRPGDERFEQITGRRPMVEATLAGLLTPGAGVSRAAWRRRRRAGARGGCPAGVPHVTGVVLDTGERIAADLVVATTGRRSSLPTMLAAIGAAPPARGGRRPPGSSTSAGTFRSADGGMPPMFGPPLQHYDSLSFVTRRPTTARGPSGCASATDLWMRRAADADVWTRIVRAYPLLAHWIDAEPITGRRDDGRHARPAYPPGRRRPDRSPPASSRSVTPRLHQPDVGRGMTLGAMQAVCLRDVLREVCACDPVDLAHRWHDRVAQRRDAARRRDAAVARHRLAEMDAQVAGTTYDTDDQRWTFFQRLFAAAPHDPEVLRAAMDVAGVFRRLDDVARREDIAVRINAVGDLPLAPGPTRHELESLIDGSPASIAV